MRVVIREDLSTKSQFDNKYGVVHHTYAHAFSNEPPKDSIYYDHYIEHCNLYCILFDELGLGAWFYLNELTRIGESI